MKYKIGDRVKCLDDMDEKCIGEIGTVINTIQDGRKLLVEFDNNIGGHTGMSSDI